MLITCPECTHEVSDRAAACPKCGYPIAEDLAEQRAAADAELERTSRRRTDAFTNCLPCKGRGFEMIAWTDDEGREKQSFTWCERCDETGRVSVVHSAGGYWSVANASVDAFVAGEIGTDSPEVISHGTEAPPPPTHGEGGTSSTS